MPRKSIGLKFEEDDLARWDAWAEVRGLTRTGLLETAVEHLIGFEAALAQMANGEVPVFPPKPLSRAGGKLDAYPGMPEDPEERLRAINERNRLMQERGVKPPKSGTFGKRVADK
jgi:hypothetical protein